MQQLFFPIPESADVKALFQALKLVASPQLLAATETNVPQTIPALQLYYAKISTKRKNSPIGLFHRRQPTRIVGI
jgi:hypothetical protein